ncbi:unannotated protein [freshwater metagenome]|uniref:Unannotated protein n=1 Tax=freshwater metagenome TaxID=449393 RepID=A0A6J7DWP2_9ZZZZ
MHVRHDLLRFEGGSRHGEAHPASRRACDDGRKRQDAAIPADDERREGEQEHDVGTEEVRVGAPAHRQEEGQAEQEAAERGDPRPHPQDDAQTGNELTEGDRQSEEGRMLRAERDEPADGTRRRGGQHLGLHPVRRVRVKIAGVEELQEPRVDEGDAEEHPQRQQDPSGLAQARFPRGRALNVRARGHWAMMAAMPDEDPCERQARVKLGLDFRLSSGFLEGARVRAPLTRFRTP